MPLRRRGTAAFFGLALGVAIALATTEARADDETPAVPAPFVLPDLTHRRLDLQLDWLVGYVSGVSGTVRDGGVASIVRASVETSVFVPGRLYAGLTVPIGFALPPDGGLVSGEAAAPAGMRRFTGNVGVHLRSVFELPTSLEIGFTLGVVVPTAVLERSYRPNISATAAVATLDPTSYADFLPGRLVLRPAGDLRIRRGPLTVQMRHGLDVIFDNSGVENVRLAGRLLGHAGVRVHPDLEISLEASQVYFFASDEASTAAPTLERAFAETYRIADGRRSAFVFGPAVRASFRDVDFGAALITNAGDPLSPVSDGFIGLRFSVIGRVAR